MAHFIKEQLFVDSSKNLNDQVCFGLQDKSTFYIANNKDDAEAIYLSFSKEDWVAIKAFIDKQFDNKFGY